MKNNYVLRTPFFLVHPVLTMGSTTMKLGFSTETFTLEGGSKQNVDVECFGLATIEKDPYTFEYFHVLLRRIYN